MSNYRAVLLAIALLLVLGVLACSFSVQTGESQKPMIEILSPPSGSRTAPGEDVAVEYRATDSVAVVRVDLEVDGRIVDAQNSPTAEGQPSLTGVLHWTPTTPGTHTLLVYAHNRDGETSEAVGLDIIVTPAAPATTPVLPTATHTLAVLSPVPPTPTQTLPPPTVVPPTPTNTLAPPTSVPPTPTRTVAAPTPVRPTPTRTPLSCPTFRINVPSGAPPYGLFAIEWDVLGAPVAPGYSYVLEFRQDQPAWGRTPPLTWKDVQGKGELWEEGGHIKAEIHGPGPGVWHWRVCLAADASGPSLCCGPPHDINHY